MKPGMPFEPGLHSWMLVGTIIVYNQIKIQSEGGFSIYLLEETDKLLVSMTRGMQSPITLPSSIEIISKRYEKGSVIITTNKSFEQWGDIFTDNILASAILDRVVHYSTIIKINGPSFRSKNLKEGRK